MHCKLPMATLHEVLSKSSPAIAEDAVTQFRSGLVFIINRLHDEVAEGIQLSLLDQTKRLDDEGYDSCKLLIILNHVTEATIGSSATQELLSFIQENVAEPDGLPLLLAHVHSSFPELARAIDELESQAIQEENQLLTVAGGMSKKAEIGLISGAVVGGILAIGYAAYQKRKSVLAERAVREEQAVKDKFYRDTAINNVDIYWEDNKKQLIDMANLSITRFNPDGTPFTFKPGADVSDIKAILNNPDRIVQPMKSLENYTTSIIENHAEQLALAHFVKFRPAIQKQVEIAFEEELRNFEDSLRENPAFKREVKSRLEQKGIESDNLSWGEIEKLPGFNAIDKDLINSGWSEGQVNKYVEDMRGSTHPLKEAFNEIKESYAAELTKEVNAAKKDVMSRAEKGYKDLLADFKLDGRFAREAELRIDSDIVSKTKGLREVVSSDVRVIKTEVEADVQAAERDVEVI